MNNLLSNWKTYLKFLDRNRTYTAIELFGLSISLLFVILIGIYVWQELSVDRFHEKRDRIYIIGSENEPATGAAIPYKLKDRYPEIEKICPVVVDGSAFPIVWNDNKYSARPMFADSTFFDLFSFRLFEGDPKRVLESNDGVVITRECARRIFGNQPAIGQSILIADTLRLTVTGVMEEIRNSSFPEADLVLPWRLIKVFNPSLAEDQLGNAAGTVCFALLREGADLKPKSAEIAAWMKEFFWIYKQDIWKEVRMERLSDFYFSGWNNGWTPLKLGDRRFVMVLLSVGVLILLFAVLNYINLTVAQAGFRAKEMATRRLLGSMRNELFWRLMFESATLCLLALILAILLTLAVIPYANDLLQTKLDPHVLLQPGWIAGLAGFVLIVGGLAGWFPALVISAAQPIEIVRGAFRTRTKMVFSKVFITFQNFITIVMLVASLVMVLQINHMLHAPLGYQTKGLYWVDLYQLDQSTHRAFLEKARTIGGITRAGLTRGLPMLGSNNMTTTFDNGGILTNISLQQYAMDREVFDMLGLKILQDDHLANPRWYFNEQAMREMNLPSDAHDVAFSGDTEPIAISGIISDFYEGNINTQISAVMLRFLKPDEPGWQALFEITGDPIATLDRLRSTYTELSGGLEMQGDFLDQTLRQSFESQIRLAKIVGIFTSVAILISLLGLLAMSTYFVQQRSLEIAVRKVYGSDSHQILTQLIRSFLIYVGIAFILALPVAWYFMNDWLKDYDYRIPLSPWIFLAAGLFCLLVAFLSVLFQSWQAANRNPIESLKDRQ